MENSEENEKQLQETADINNRGSAVLPFWKDPKTVTIIAALLAAIQPIVVAIDGSFKSHSQIEIEKIQKQNSIRQEYLKYFVGEKKATDEEQLKILRLLARISSDKDLKDWADTELKEVNLKKLETKRQEDIQKLETNQQTISQSTISNEEKQKLEKQSDQLKQQISESGAKQITISKELGKEVINNPIVFIQYTNPSKKDIANKIKTYLSQSNYTSPRIELVKAGKISKSQIRYFYEADKDDADKIKTRLQESFSGELGEIEMIDLSGKFRVGSKQFELWIKS
jgi:hypothetical protein